MVVVVGATWTVRRAFAVVVPAAILAIAAPTAAGRAPHRALAHPQDGPHIDLRIQVADDAIRLEAIVNLAFADELVEPARESVDTIHPVEWDALHGSLMARMHELNRFTVDGKVLEPVAGEFEVVDPDSSLVGLFPAYGARALTQIHLDWEYPLDAPPETVTIAWGAYPDDTTERRLGIEAPREVLARLAAGGIDSVVTFQEGAEPFVWSASGATEDHLLPVPAFAPQVGYELPVLSLGLLSATLLCAVAFAARPRRGRGRAQLLVLASLLAGTVLARDRVRVSIGAEGRLPGEAQALATFAPLHANIYRAFDYTEESDVYDALARCVEGDLLERLFGEIYDSLVQEEAAGAVGSVQGLRPLATTVSAIALEDGWPRFDVDARWQVEGAVFHWGHAHWRVQELAAHYVVRQGANGWRIADSRITEQVLVSATQDRPGVDGDLEIPEEL